MKHFLLVFDRTAGRLVEEAAYADAKEALAARFAREEVERNNPEIEVVVLSAEDREALERTHSRYFGTAGKLTLA